jgi:uncharacterized protein
MDITPIVPADRQLIQSYGDGHFRISGQHHQGSVIVFPERTLVWAVADPFAITLEALAAVTAPDAKVEILLIGTGRKASLISAELRQALRAQRIVVEAMDTGAACRTYNVLLAEERRVAAALIAV